MTTACHHDPGPISADNLADRPAQLLLMRNLPFKARKVPDGGHTSERKDILVRLLTKPLARFKPKW